MGDSERGSQQAKSKSNKITEIKIKSKKAADNSCGFKLPGLANYGSPKRNSPKLTKAKSRTRDMGERLLDGANDEYSHTELLQVSNDTMLLLLNSGIEETVRGSTRNRRASPCMMYYTAGSR